MRWNSNPRAAVADMSHPGDLLSDGETGQRFDAEDSPSSTQDSTGTLILHGPRGRGCILWNASYGAARDVAQVNYSVACLPL